MKNISNIIRILFLVLFVFLIVNGKVSIWLALFAISLVVALVFGRVYCGYICPMNTLMIPTNFLSKKFKFQTTKKPTWLKKGYFPWVALIISVVIMLFSKKVLQTNLPILPFWLAISVLVTLRYKPSVFHNLICPFGVLLRTFGRFARISKKVDEKACIGCKLCEEVCPSEAIMVTKDNNKAVIETMLCFQCDSCSQVCPKDAIRYRKL